jgi:hypothetical protein
MIVARIGDDKHVHRDDGSWMSTSFGWYLPHQVEARQAWGRALAAELNRLIAARPLLSELIAANPPGIQLS